MEAPRISGEQSAGANWMVYFVVASDDLCSGLVSAKLYESQTWRLGGISGLCPLSCQPSKPSNFAFARI